MKRISIDIGHVPNVALDLVSREERCALTCNNVPVMAEISTLRHQLTGVVLARAYRRAPEIELHDKSDGVMHHPVLDVTIIVELFENGDTFYVPARINEPTRIVGNDPDFPSLVAIPHLMDGRFTMQWFNAAKRMHVE